MTTTRVTGTVRRASLEGGLWVLTSPDGTSYELRDAPDDLRKDGLKVEVTGIIDDDAVGIGMVGEVIRVKSFRAT